MIYLYQDAILDTLPSLPWKITRACVCERENFEALCTKSNVASSNGTKGVSLIGTCMDKLLNGIDNEDKIKRQIISYELLDSHVL